VTVATIGEVSALTLRQTRQQMKTILPGTRAHRLLSRRYETALAQAQRSGGLNTRCSVWAGKIALTVVRSPFSYGFERHQSASRVMIHHQHT
jgi:hypothetical protein